MLRTLILSAALLTPTQALAFEITGTAGTKLEASEIAKFDEPWAMTFLPDGSMLVSEKAGRLFHVSKSGKKKKIKGIPKVAYGGQGGLGDIVLHPEYEKNSLVYFSFAKEKNGHRGAVVNRAKLKLDKKGGGKLSKIKTVWKQKPKVGGKGHYSHRIAFGPKGSPHEGKMFITSGDRQKLSPAQDWKSALGKIIRLNLDGTIPKDNPWQDGSKGKRARTYWSLGHRNMLGISFAPDGKLWSHEMGPKHGDELNLIEKGKNYGWPVVSNGNHYNGAAIPDHPTRPEFNPPKAFWVPSIAPSGLVLYSGAMFKDWQGDALIGGLVSRALVRVDINDGAAKEAERFEWNKRIREVEQDPDGAIYVLEDKSGARLLRLTKG